MVGRAGPFAGVRVVDLSDRLSGAFAARLFGDYGAEVTLAEPPEGHVLRSMPPYVDDVAGIERSVVHGYVNWNKRSVIVVDDHERSELARNADVVVSTGSTAPVPENVVHLSITPHGLTGPLAHIPGNHLTACARTGWALMNAFTDEPPLQLPVDLTGYLAGIVGFTAAAAALFDRDGRGDLVDVSELEVLATTTAPWATASVFRDEHTDGGPGGRRRRGQVGPLYDAADGRLVLGFGEWSDWPAAMRLIGLHEFADDPVLSVKAGRHQQDLRPIAAAAACTLPEIARWPLFKALGAMRCGSGVVQDMSDLVVDEQFAARQFLVETSIDGRTVRAPGSPARTSPPLWHLQAPAPRLGRHRAVASEISSADQVATSSAGDGPRRNPLEGTRVLAFTQAWSGTFGTELLAFLGADVVQIELLQRPDIWRMVTAEVPSGVRRTEGRQLPVNTQGLYNSVNLAKRAITLDMSDERGRELFWRMVPNFDVVAENFAPHVMEKWGITLDTLAAARPDVIFASISGYGRGGPYSLFPANGSTIEPMSGLSSLHGYADGPAMNTGGLLPDPTAGMTLAAAVVAALHQRRRSSAPQRVDISMSEAMAATLGDAVAQFDAGGGVRQPTGNRHPGVVPHGYYPSAEGEWVAIAADTEMAWRVLAAEVGVGDDERFTTLQARQANEGDLNAVIEAWCATRTADQVMALSAQGVSVATVASLTDLLRSPSPHLVERGFLRTIDHPESGPSLVAHVPWVLSGRAAPSAGAAPRVGEHSRSVLQQDLGITDDEYQALVDDGVTGML